MTNKAKRAFELPDVPTVYRLEVVVMPNGEVLCLGKSLGFVSKLGHFLTPGAGMAGAVLDGIKEGGSK